MGKSECPPAGSFDSWRNERLQKLRQLTFHHFPESIPAARPVQTNATGIIKLETEPGIVIRLRPLHPSKTANARVWILVTGSDADDPEPGWLQNFAANQDAVYCCEPRGIGGSRWTRKNPPNYVERAHYLLGRTVDSGRVWDLAATAGYLRQLHQAQSAIHLAGEGASAVLSIYAALVDSHIAGLLLVRPCVSHRDDAAPALLNVLRVCDVPEAAGMLVPRELTVVGAPAGWNRQVAALFASAGATAKLSVRE
jgi:hypothetical protein